MKPIRMISYVLYYMSLTKYEQVLTNVLVAFMYE